MPLDLYQTGLPVTDLIDVVKKHLTEKNTLIVHAPPGAGKSTLLPLTLLNESWLEGRKIIMLEPRRLAARSIATRMAELWGEDVGQTIGYRVRFENRISKNTRLEVVTEGILTRMLQSDNALEDVALVIFDEFHERSIHADLAMALCREAQEVLRPDLRMMIMSATLNTTELSQLLKAPVASSEGKQYPVEVFYTDDIGDERLVAEITARQVLKATKTHEGDTLVFMPGEGEIKKCAELLSVELPTYAIHPLYGQLPQNAQKAAILPDKTGRRKIVIATNIAETSLTIEGIKIVVDTGFRKRMKFDPRSGLSKLETVTITKDSADQRAGRAGRLSAGVCYRLWSRSTQERMGEHRVPELVESDLAPLMLDMAAWGVSDVFQLTWLTPPPKASVSQALDTLHQLNALENGRITPHGKQIHQLACHPRIAHMLLLATETRAKQLGTDIAAILEERDPMSRETGVDINLRVEALRRARKNGNAGRFGQIEKVAESYRRMLEIDIDNGPVDPYETGLLLAYAYPERIASARPGNNAQFQLANGRLAMFGHKDDLAAESWLAVANVDTRDGMGKIFLAAPLNPKDLLPLVKQQDIITWDTRKGGLIASRELRIGSIVLQSKPLPSPDAQHLQTAISKAIQTEGENLLNLDEKFLNLQNRIFSLRKWNPEQVWPDFSTPALLYSNQEWLGPYLKDVKKPEDLKRLDLAHILLHSLDWDTQQLLEKLAPARIEVPSGSTIQLEYFSNGATPVLSVRLQEVFGLSDTPTVNNGKMPVLLHLLSPGYKPVQVTGDLRSFWNNTYFEVKKELQRRYPKHSWPEDPWSAVPVAKGRSKK